MLDCLRLPAGARVLACLGWLIIGSSAHAEVVPDLYRATVLVPGQDEKSRNQALRPALEQVLVKVSGTDQLAANAEIQSALAQPQRWLDAYRYESTTEQLDSGSGLRPATHLIVTFASRGVDDLLHRAGLPVWPANRPGVLVWLVADHPEFGPTLVAPTEQPELYEALTTVAARRGLPVLRPLLDLEDQMALTAEQVWNGDATAISAASERYSTNVVVVGRVSTLPTGEPMISWLLLHQDQQQMFESMGADMPAIMADGVARTANYLAGIYAIAPNAQGGGDLQLEIRGVDTFADYNGLIHYLEQQGVVSRMQLLGVNGSVVRVKLMSQGDRTLLINALQIDRKLIPDGAAVVAPAALDVVAAADPASDPILVAPEPEPEPEPEPLPAAGTEPLIFYWAQ